MRILLFNLATDLDHSILGFTTSWVNAIATKVEHVNVITMTAGSLGVLDSVNVYSVGQEKGYSKARRLVEFYKHLTHILSSEKVDACFSHMNPLFTVLAAPLLKAKGIPIVTWYAHPSITTKLKLAHKLSDRMVASISSAYPYKKDKFVVVGQGIDTNIFKPRNELIENQEKTILCAGRLSPIKDHSTLLRAAAKLREITDTSFRIIILGGTPNEEGKRYKQELGQLIKKLDLGEKVEFIDGVPMNELPFWYQQCDIHINLTPKGFGDKVAWEAMSCGKPCIVANEGFKETLGRYEEPLLFQYQNSNDLAKKMHKILSLTQLERERIGYYLRDQVIKLHSLKNLSSNIVNLLQSLCSSHLT